MQFDPAFGGVGCGTPGGAWAETVLLSFGSGSDGDGPGYGALIIDAAGNLYGTTSLGGARGRYYVSCGTIFKVAPDGTERVLYALKGGSDGGTPLGGLIADASGNLYGTTSAGGGTSGCYPFGSCSTVFKLAPDGTRDGPLCLSRRKRWQHRRRRTVQWPAMAISRARTSTAALMAGAQYLS